MSVVTSRAANLWCLSSALQPLPHLPS
jgi:hypothetical protein